MPKKTTTKSNSKRDRVLQALQKGGRITVQQMVNKFGFASPNSATATISYLREEGFKIALVETRGGTGFAYELA